MKFSWKVLKVGVGMEDTSRSKRRTNCYWKHPQPGIKGPIDKASLKMSSQFKITNYTKLFTRQDSICPNPWNNIVHKNFTILKFIKNIKEHKTQWEKVLSSELSISGLSMLHASVVLSFHWVCSISLNKYITLFIHSTEWIDRHVVCFQFLVGPWTFLIMRQSQD